MSIRHMSDVWSDPYFTQRSKTRLLVALAIADCARSEDGRAWPSVDYLARKARTSVRGVQDACSAMQRDGRLLIETGAGMHGTNVYRLVTPPQPLHPPRNEAALQAAEEPADEAARRCGEIIRNQKEPPNEPPGTRKGDFVRAEALDVDLDGKKERQPDRTPSQASMPLKEVRRDSQRPRTGGSKGNPKHEMMEEVKEKPEFPSALDTEAFRAKWSEYEAYRRERKLPRLTPMSVQKKLEELAEWGAEESMRSIGQTIGNGWSGLFAPRREAQGSSAINRRKPATTLPPELDW